jgi:iron complex outermembrane receptor protein
MNLTAKKTALALGLVACQTAVAATTLEEVIVTAQFKEQSLQDASVAVDAFTGDQLRAQGVNSAEGLSQLVPALTITAGGGIASSLYMRGIGNSARNNYLDPAIILNYDGVPIARGSATSIAGFFDLNRVEVLKGPQGTLYGKNATGGVLNLNPAKPVIGENSGFISGAFGNYSASEFTAAINVALGDNSALRVSAALYDRDGYSSDGTNDDDRTSIRVQYLAQVNDRLTIRLSADSTDIGGVGGNPDIVGRYSPQFDLILDGNAPGTGMLSDEANDYRTTVLSAPGFGFLQPITDQWRT